MIFVDSDVPMYLVGASHPHKLDAQRALERFIADERKLVCDAEVLQEILHRYGALQRLDAVQPAFELLLSLVDEVFPVDLEVVRRAKDILLATGTLSARDALHVATMESRGVEEILSFDTGFDEYPGVRRLSE